MHAWDCPCGTRNAPQLPTCHACGRPIGHGRPVIVGGVPPPQASAARHRTPVWRKALIGFGVVVGLAAFALAADPRHRLLYGFRTPIHQQDVYEADVSGDPFMIRCPTCKGTGLAPHMRGEGDDGAYRHLPADLYYKCPACQGTCRVPASRYLHVVIVPQDEPTIYDR